MFATQAATIRTGARLSSLAGRFAAAAALLLFAAGAMTAKADDRDDQTDPPARVGRISLLSGSVTLNDYRNSSSEAANLNWPVTSEHSLITGNLGRAEVRIGSLAVRLDADTQVDFNRIDDSAIQLIVQRGGVSLRIRNREMLREIDVATPRERIAFDDVGRYRIDVDRVDGVTAVTAHVGHARINAANGSFNVASGQRAEVYGGDLPRMQLVSPSLDSFDDWAIARDRRDDSIRSAQYVSPETTGIESLDEYGTWRTVDSYGPVWYPTVVRVGWVPYRHGRWSYIDPWGWTWIDEAPWGFAPFHYGRWVFVSGAWGWVPGGYVRRPVYAPALVAWFGSPGVSVGVTIGDGPIGWCPLGPREIYVPGYWASRTYVNQVNYGHVTNITSITVINPPPRYVYQTNPTVVTWVPPDTLRNRAPVYPRVGNPPPRWEQAPIAIAPPDLGMKRRPTNPTGGPVSGFVDPPRPQGAPQQAAPGFATTDRVLTNRNSARNVPESTGSTRQFVPNQGQEGAPPVRRPAAPGVVTSNAQGISPMPAPVTSPPTRRGDDVAPGMKNIIRPPTQPEAPVAAPRVVPPAVAAPPRRVEQSNIQPPPQRRVERPAVQAPAPQAAAPPVAAPPPRHDERQNGQQANNPEQPTMRARPVPQQDGGNDQRGRRPQMNLQ